MKRFGIIVLVTMMAIWVGVMAKDAHAAHDTNISISPMNESMVLNPGDVYKSSFLVVNPGFSEDILYYHTVIKPFYVDENYDPVFENIGSSQIAEWITITSGATGALGPNESGRVEFTINVPENAPAGGQYAVIEAEVDLEPATTGAINIGEGMGINHVILAEITGETVISGDILDAGVSGFMLGGDITAYSTVENTGNVHGVAKYLMEVRPLFSDEVIYSNNMESVETHYVLPDRKLYNETRWMETPSIGIFNVSYIVEFQGLRSEVTRIVIVCPWWLVFMIVFGALVLIIKIISSIKIRKERKAVNF